MEGLHPKTLLKYLSHLIIIAKLVGYPGAFFYFSDGYASPKRLSYKESGHSYEKMVVRE